MPQKLICVLLTIAYVLEKVADNRQHESTVMQYQFFLSHMQEKDRAYLAI